MGNRFALGITPGGNTDQIALLGHDPKTRGQRFVESIKLSRDSGVTIYLVSKVSTSNLKT
jgi:alkanesulfonate monooxygenase SsuD/methylene tetrahydromethanopterin reductase-like flavin-dependent oxidoreductase (luciferase family)